VAERRVLVGADRALAAERDLSPFNSLSRRRKRAEGTTRSGAEDALERDADEDGLGGQRDAERVAYPVPDLPGQCH
jgi:hypothetical protein